MRRRLSAPGLRVLGLRVLGLRVLGLRVLGLLALGLLAMTGCTAAPPIAMSLTGLPGWAEADHEAALAEFRRVCCDARYSGDPPPGWAAVCVAASRATDARAFFETAFRPRYQSGTALITGYYEPVVEGALVPDDRFEVPLYALPADLDPSTPYLTRAEIVAGALASRGLELVWLADPVEAFFLQIQGSGRVRLPDGRLVRLGYAGKNGHPYVALGRLLVERGEMELGRVTADAIKTWLRADPARRARLMNENPSYVFFRELADLPPEAGPIGTLGLPLAAGRSAAVDPAFHPLGLPIWIDAPGPHRGLWIAMDTGGAIRGAGRADLFLGTGAAAGAAAGALRAEGQVIGLVPKGAG